jgi:23S rRNA pseudouridine2605 synthase
MKKRKNTLSKEDLKEKFEGIGSDPNENRSNSRNSSRSGGNRRSDGDDRKRRDNDRPGNFKPRSSRDNDRKERKDSETKSDYKRNKPSVDSSGKKVRRNTKSNVQGSLFEAEKPNKDDQNRTDRPKRESRDRDDRSKPEPRDRDHKPKRDYKNEDRKPYDKKESYGSDQKRSFRKPTQDGDGSLKRKERKPANFSKPSKDKGYMEGFYKENKKKRKVDFKVKDELIVPKEKRGQSEYTETRYGSKDLDKKVRKLGADDSKKPLMRGRESAPIKERENAEEQMPLNKFVSRAGICSRREAAELIKKGEVKVNGNVLTEPGYKVQETDKVEYNGTVLNELEPPVYFLLNKAKDFITTTDDPEGRKTVMDLFTDIKERIFPVGRLDRNTTGLLLLTNDGQLAQKLSHPKFQNKKIYQVKLDKDLDPDHYNEIMNGLELEDGKALVDSLAYTDPKNRNEVGIEIHIGKNRIVRRIFESLGYEVKNLDRVTYAGLTKKNLPRGKWRPLTSKEIIFLKHFK